MYLCAVPYRESYDISIKMSACRNLLRKYSTVFHRSGKEIIEHPIVNTPNGQLRGKTAINWRNNIYYSFQGIPYAKPPLEELRFKAPVPPEKWSGTRDALNEGNPCYSRHMISSKLIGSEDCLYLNVYTPEITDNLKPVMVWIHGGGFVQGSSSTELYGPEFLVSEDIVLVTINYRLGLLGFAKIDNPSLEVPGNAGLKDQLLALQWVQNNIRNFGGDSTNVTIFGESSGGSSIHYLVLSPLAKGLFHRAIIQSGTTLHQFAKGQSTSPLVAQALQLQGTSEEKILQILSQMSVNDLYSLQEKIPDRFFPSERKPVGPTVDLSCIFDKASSCLTKGKYNSVPLMIGYTSNEGMYLALIAKKAYGDVKLPKDFKRAVPYFMNIPKNNKDLLEHVANEIKEFYYGQEDPSLNNMFPFYALNSDNYFLREINTTVRLHTELSSVPVYYYRMSLDSNLNIMKKIANISDKGTCHGDDIGYLFKTVSTPTISPNSIEKTSIEKCLKLWVNFARFGNPNANNSGDSVQWKPTEPGKLHFMDIGDNLTVGINPEQERMKFWDQLFRKYNIDPSDT